MSRWISAALIGAAAWAMPVIADADPPWKDKGWKHADKNYEKWLKEQRKQWDRARKESEKARERAEEYWEDRREREEDLRERRREALEDYWDDYDDALEDAREDGRPFVPPAPPRGFYRGYDGRIYPTPAPYGHPGGYIPGGYYDQRYEYVPR
jgi:hypothetical protein